MSYSLVDHPQGTERLNRQDRFDDNCRSPKFLVQGMFERIENDHR
jgi:hypothetical protein